MQINDVKNELMNMKNDKHNYSLNDDDIKNIEKCLNDINYIKQFKNNIHKNCLNDLFKIIDIELIKYNIEYIAYQFDETFDKNMNDIELINKIIINDEL